jgi:hypothetical protein
MAKHSSNKVSRWIGSSTRPAAARKYGGLQISPDERPRYSRGCIGAKCGTTSPLGNVLTITASELGVSSARRFPSAPRIARRSAGWSVPHELLGRRLGT